MRKKKQKAIILEYNVIFSGAEEGGFTVIVPDLPGCISEGDTFEEAKANIAEAIELYLEDADEELYFVSPEESRRQFLSPVQVQIA